SRRLEPVRARRPRRDTAPWILKHPDGARNSHLAYTAASGKRLLNRIRGVRAAGGMGETPAWRGTGGPTWPASGTRATLPEGFSTPRPGTRKAHGTAGTRDKFVVPGPRSAGSPQSGATNLSRVPEAGLKQPSPRCIHNRTLGRRIADPA